MSRYTGFNILLALSLSLSGTLLTGCESEPSKSATQTKSEVGTSPISSPDNNHADIFEGCYTIVKSEPALIKIAQVDERLIMQTKEPSSAKRVWDDPEPLEVINVDKTPKYFSIDSDKVTHLIARPDRLLVIAHVDNAYVNSHPLLDSDYLGFILQGANTIFKVQCDEIPIEEIDDDRDVVLKPIVTVN